MIAPIRPRVTVEAICVAIADAQPRTPVDDNLQAALEYGLLTHVTWDYAGLRHVVTLSLPAALGDIKLATAYLEQPPEVIRKATRSAIRSSSSPATIARWKPRRSPKSSRARSPTASSPTFGCSPNGAT